MLSYDSLGIGILNGICSEVLSLGTGFEVASPWQSSLLPYSTDSLLSLGSATQRWTGAEQNCASRFLWRVVLTHLVGQHLWVWLLWLSLPCKQGSP